MKNRKIKSPKKRPDPELECNDKYRELFENVHDGIYQSTIDGRILTANPALVTMLGYESEDELKTKNIASDIYVNASDRDTYLKKIEEKGNLEDTELILKKKDGSQIIVLEHSHVVQNSKGEILYYEGTLTDITQRKKAEEELMFLKHSVDNHFDGAYWMDRENRFFYVNDAACAATGYTRSELIGQHVRLINHDATDSNMILVWDYLKKNGSFKTESRHFRKDGTSFPVEIVSTLVMFGGKEFNCGFARDITERKRAAEDIRLRLDQLRQIIDLVPSYIFAKDIDGQFLLVNKALAEVFGLPPEEIVGKTDKDYGASEKEIKGYRDADLTVIEKGVPVIIPEEQVLRKDGTLGWFQTVKIPYKHPGWDRPAILGVATEITERKEIEDHLRENEEKFRKLYERAEESDRLKTAFLHNISHEIKTPMNAIVGFTSLMESPELSEETRKQYIDIIYKSSNQLLSIISDIVDISNIESGHIKLSLEKVNINVLIRNIYEQYSRRAKMENISLTITSALDDSSAITICDEVKLIQVISNLLNNALKFTTQGSIDFGYVLINNYLQFFVKDTGIGIEKGDFIKIFDRFYQIESPLQKSGGTGLGLSICKAYVEMMGGKIWLESQPGKGSTFFFTLPFGNELVNASYEKERIKPERIIISPGKFILIAEDNDNSFLLLKEMLAIHKPNIIRAINGLEAVNICRDQAKIDLVLMDIKMPVMDGYEAATKINSEKADLPIVAVTAYAKELDNEKILSSGFSDHISKPVDRDQLNSILKRYLD